jgi:hypothetical protein
MPGFRTLSRRVCEQQACLRTLLASKVAVLTLTLFAAFSLMPASATAQPPVPDDPGTGSVSENREHAPGRPAAPASHARDHAQDSTSPSANAYVPISGTERVDWIVSGTVGPRSLGVGVLAATWQTGFNVPREWGQTWNGFGKRYVEREADVAISNTIEAGLGALWGEDPRYIRSGRHGIWPRTRYALKTVFLAQRSSGRLAPAWGRYAGNVFNNIIENEWLPPSITTWGQTTVRSANGFLGRAAGNLWDEFWPDVRRRLKKRSPPEAFLPDRVSRPAERTRAWGPSIADRRRNRTP